MTTPTTYLDWNATAPTEPAAIAAMADAAAHWANPSSVHAGGRSARAALEAARRSVAGNLGVAADSIIFTSGATEALALALNQCRLKGRLVSAVEHDAVRANAGERSRVLGVDDDGVIDLAALDLILGECPEPALVAVMHANNETGVVQPLAAVAERVRAAGGALLADCVQTAGKLDLPDADFIAVSAHKLGGPPGVGALIARRLDLLHAAREGGGHERGYRAGTENLAGIAGFAAALAARADRGWLVQAARLRDRLEAGVRAIASDIAIAGAGADRLPTTSAIRLPGVPAATQLIALDLDGVCVSAGAACSSGRVRASHVLGAMGWNEAAAGETIRVSLGWTTGEDDIDRFLASYGRIARRRRSAA